MPEAKAMKEWFEGAKAKGGAAASFQVRETPSLSPYR